MMIETLTINDIFYSYKDKFKSAQPFSYIVIDNFFTEEIAEQLYAEFPEYSSQMWHVYDNAIENKKTCNDWNKFPSTTYRVFSYLNSAEFVSKLSLIVDGKLYSDPGLHGGGWHMHGRGGKLNVHLDYDIHPKLNLQRRLNLIVYMSKEWDSSWGGGLELWDHDSETNQPKSCVAKIENKFNRAVLFDTTQNSWHGLPDELNCPSSEYRRSFATYYLHEPFDNATDRKKALFAPHKDQKSDSRVLDLIKKRVDVNSYSQAYKDEL